MFIYNNIDYTEIYNSKYSIADYKSHSMGESLKQYLEIKIPKEIYKDEIKEIHIIGKYIRNNKLLAKEKTNKLFNYKRPNIEINNKIATIYCYPGIDYTFHYASLISTYMSILKLKKEILVKFPKKELIIEEILKSNLIHIPKCNTVILGYVEGLESLSRDTYWQGNGDFQWKIINKEKLLLGCKHSYWGDISGVIVSILADIGIKNVIYIGKLGTLDSTISPNEFIATGSKSIFIDGSSIKWDNIFKNINLDIVKHGIHYTLPSIIQESKKWVLHNKDKIKFVDPEIGHMAKAAINKNIKFSYLHIISDNLSQKYDEDLSNERKKEILIKRKKLLKIIKECIEKI